MIFRQLVYRRLSTGVSTGGAVGFKRCGGLGFDPRREIGACFSNGRLDACSTRGARKGRAEKHAFLLKCFSGGIAGRLNTVRQFIYLVVQ